jgi:hypothetical protein
MFLQDVTPTISMALLQGYLLRHKDNPEGALRNLAHLTSGEYNYSPAMHSVTAKSTTCAKATVKPIVHKRTHADGRITAEEVDKMIFNPQEGWDKDIKNT